MRKTITIAGINIKNGQTKQGKDWTRYGFYSGDQWYNLWADLSDNPQPWNLALQQAMENDTIEIYFVKKEFKGKPQYEIIDPSSPEIVEEEKKEGAIKELKEAITKLTNRLEIVEAQLEEKEIPSGHLENDQEAENKETPPDWVEEK